jgi:lathosterol oxidase
MDVVLEGFDTFLFDRLYATIFPATPGVAAYNAFKNVANATVSSMRETPTAYQNNFQFRPASKYFSFEPSSYAYSSSWQRDDMGRQALSLFLITWYVLLRRRLTLWQRLTGTYSGYSE